MSVPVTPEVRALQAIAGETWAIVYAYESPRHPRGLWYDRWRYDVLNDYVRAVSELGVEPFVVDIDSFLASDRLRAGEFDFVINLNSGATPISNLGVVPSLAAWHKVGCFPNSADVILAGERKDLCKRVFAQWFNIPQDVDPEGADPVIFKPKTMGNSQFVERERPPLPKDDLIAETFIRGYDVTVPVFYDGDRDAYVVASAIAYLPETPDPPGWFLSYDQKMDRSIVIDRAVRRLSPSLEAALLDASRAFQFQSIARFDFRWKTEDPGDRQVNLEDLWFLEINCLPTLRRDVNFLKGLKDHLAISPCNALSGIADEDIRALAFLMLKARSRPQDQMKK